MCVCVCVCVCVCGPDCECNVLDAVYCQLYFGPLTVFDWVV